MEMESDEDLATCLGVLHRLAAADGTARPEYSHQRYRELRFSLTLGDVGACYSYTLSLSHQPVLS